MNVYRYMKKRIGRNGSGRSNHPSTSISQTSTEKLACPFKFNEDSMSVRDAYGEEVHLFLHVHLRGYDREGKGRHMDSSYYDKYGAPVATENSWMEGYHSVESTLVNHTNHCSNEGMQFPYVAGMAGAVHLYKPIHDDKPWNWTGWVPLQRKWLCGGTFFSNRHFLALRGNEIQNNLWDYHPHEEVDGKEAVEDLEFSQIKPTDEYRGGYFFHKKTFGRYLHVISLKSHVRNSKTRRYERYNYIVHPLAYRSALNDLPDNSVDAMQWSIIHIATEKHFGDNDEWGDKVHALEIFNDFTYFHSYEPDPNNGINCSNGEVAQGQGKTEYIYWFNTYPLEFGEFLLDSALARSVYLQTLTSNDAFYERSVLPINAEENEKDKNEVKVLYSDPKASLIARKQSVTEKIKYHQTKLEKRIRGRGDTSAALDFLNTRPYRCNTAFGYTTLIDTRKKLKTSVFCTEDEGTNIKMREDGLNKGEQKAMDYLTRGRFYSHTGVYDLFQYDHDRHDGQVIPYTIQNQSDKDELCYKMTKDMDLVFTFAKCKSTCQTPDLVWRYSIMTLTKSNTIETTHGYFKLDERKMTKLDLSNYDKREVKWIYFTAFNQLNPQRRAWFNAIKGLAFNTTKAKFPDVPPLPDLHHKVVSTCKKDSASQKDSIITEQTIIQPIECESGNLDFTFDVCPSNEDACIYVYFMQVQPHQQDLSREGTKNSSEEIPPRVLQSVHGYFTLHDEHPTRLCLSSSWDKETVKDKKVYFYAIHAENGRPMPVNTKPKPYSVEFSKLAVVHEEENLE